MHLPICLTIPQNPYALSPQPLLSGPAHLVYLANPWQTLCKFANPWHFSSLQGKSVGLDSPPAMRAVVSALGKPLAKPYPSA